MLTDLIFSFNQEIRNEEVFLLIHIYKKNSSDKVYYRDLQAFEKESKDLAVFLQKAKCKELKISYPSKENTILCSAVKVSASQVLDVIKKLTSARKLQWKERGVFFNPLSRVKVALEVEAVGEDALILSGVVDVDKTVYDMGSLDFLFHSEEISFAIVKQVLFIFPEDMDLSWLKFFSFKAQILEGKERKSFIYKYKEDPPHNFPKINWKGEYGEKQIEESLKSVLPCLELKDKAGMFADLVMEYENIRISFADAKPFVGRDSTSERAWEKDLLETGFQKKISYDAHYYCPTDKIAKSLTFLLEIGWKILDHTGKKIVRMTNRDLTVSLEREALIVKGRFAFADYTADLSDVIGAFERKERFLNLSENHVGWLEEECVSQGLEDLVHAERVVEGRRLNKAHFGVLEGLSFSALDPKVETLLNPRVVQVEDRQFQGTLWPYQEEGKKWFFSLYEQGFSGLLADEMGLGKTVQTLSFLSALPQGKPHLIIAPTSLLFNWKKEWEQFIPHKKLYVHAGPKRQDFSVLEQQEAILTSYSYLRIDHMLFSKLSCSCIVLDEAQWIKNPESQLARAAFGLKAEMKICLSGTPIENRIEDLWSLFHFLHPSLLGEKEDFIAKMTASEWDKRYQKSLQKKIRPFILRRKKEEVLQDLPLKLEQTVFVEMGEIQRAFYEEWLFKTRQGLLSKTTLEGAAAHRMEVLEAILRLRQICVDPRLVQADAIVASAKVERILDDLEEIISLKRKVLIYSQFTTMLRLFEKKIVELGYSYVYLDGETKDRETPVSIFQNDPTVSIFLISLKAGGVGLNLTAADYVFLLDPWWNEAVERQAMDRAHRLGRKDTVIVRRYICAESIEEKMMKLKAHKVGLSEGLLDYRGDALTIDQMTDFILSD
jgi:superfamily II DNA or RNA helicase